MAAARAEGDREAELQGVNWRVADLFELGDRAALDEAVAGHERLAEALRLPAYLWWGPMWRATLAVLDDRMDEAQAHAARGVAIGLAALDANADVLVAAQRLGLDISSRALTAEDHAAARARAERSPARWAWAGGLAIGAVALGDLDGAREEVEAGMRHLPAAAVDVNWLYTVHSLGVVAARLGDVTAARVAYPLLRPHAHRTVTIGRGCFCVGSAALTLGLLASALGDEDAARDHLEDAVRRNDRLGAVAYAAVSRRALAARTGDPARAAELRREAAGVGGASLPPGLYEHG